MNASQFKVAAREVLETKVHELKAHGAELAVKYTNNSFVPLKKLGWKQGDGPARHLRAVLKNVWL